MSLERRSARITPRENAPALLYMFKAMFKSVKAIQDSKSLDQASEVMLHMADEKIVKPAKETKNEKLAREARIDVQHRLRTVIKHYEIK